MTTVKLKIKINNSYESEPSSGSGSSASEANDYEHSTCEGDPNLPLMLNPGFYSMSNRVPATNVEQVASPHIKRYDAPIDSSQESDFEGFTESQIENQRAVVIETTKLKLQSHSKGQSHISAEHSGDKISAGQKVFSRFYDVVIEQNSCNAVDMQLSGENRIETPENQKNFSEEPPSELSFNGKIKSLTSETTGAAIEFGSQEQNACKSPKILKTILETTETTNFKYTNERSPDLFGDNDDDDDDEEEEMAHVSAKISANVSASVEEETVTEEMNKSLNCPTESSFADENNENTTYEDENLLRKNIRREKELLKRIKTCLAGIPPPPSLTIPQLDMFSAIIKRKNDILNFKTEVETIGSIILCEEEGLFKPSHTVEEVKAMPWKEILGARQHGLSFNLCRASENIELLSLAVIERFVGAETTSSYNASYTCSPSSAKKRNLRLKMLTQSPGNRLSHLAKRRAIFSSANLATTSQKSSNTSLGGMQILLDKKKGKSRRKGTTPKRMTPASKKKNVRKTPSSSARKRLFFRSENVKSGPSRESSKRALFQSPAKQQKPTVVAAKPTFKPDIANRVEKSKRALFSPDKFSQSSLLPSASSGIECGSFSQTSQSSLFGGNLDSLILKRKRTEDDISGITENNKKNYRCDAQILIPRSLKIKSQSFCIGAGSTNSISGSNTLRSNSNISTTSVYSSSSSSGRPITRASSDTTFTSSSHLTENHRKKLLWAVSQALQAKQINVTHGNFKQFASVLARVVRRLFQEYFQKSSSSTSETMLRLAKKHVYNVIAGKTADDIYLHAKSKIDEEKRMSTTRLSGYIAPDEYQSRKTVLSQTSLCNFENSMDSFSFSQTSSMSLTQPMQNSQNSEKISLEKPPSSKSAMKLSIQPNASLQNSSSKNNLGGIALRENVDCEQRRSAQKNFTGKDQRNVSPYVSTAGRSSKQGTSYGSSLYEMNSSTARAKRQISFDS